MKQTSGFQISNLLKLISHIDFGYSTAQHGRRQAFALARARALARIRIQDASSDYSDVAHAPPHGQQCIHVLGL